MSGTALDVFLEPRLGARTSARRQRVTTGSDVVVWLDVRNDATRALIPAVVGVAAVYWLPGTRDDESAAQPLLPVEALPGTWQAVVPETIPGTYVVWWMAAGQTAEIVFDVSSLGEVTLTSTGTVPWGDVQAVAAAAGASAALPEARRVALEVGASAGALAAPAAALAAIAPQVAQVDADAMAVELSRQQVAAAVQAVPAQAVAAATPAGADAGTAAAIVVVGSKLDKAGGNMTGALGLVDPTQASHAVSKGWTESRLFTVASRAAAVAGSVLIPWTIVTGVTVMGYASAGDGGKGDYRPVASEPSHEGKFFNNSRWFELNERQVDPRMLGARADGVTDDSLAVQRTAALVNGKSAPALAQYPLPGQPVLSFGPGCYNAPGLVIDSMATGWTVLCSGVATQLQGIRFRFGGNRQSFSGMPIITGAGSFGIERYNPAARNFTCDRPYVRDRTIGYLLTGGSQDGYLAPVAEKCETGMLVDGGGGAQVVLGQFLNGSGYGIDLRKSGEMKFSNCTGLGNGIRNLRVFGTNRKAAVESYFEQCTFTVGQRNRLIPVLSVADNGSGIARVTFAAAVPVTAVATRGARLVVPAVGTDPASSAINVGNNTGGSWDGLLVGGVQVMTGPVPWTGSRTAMSSAIVAQINAAAVIPTLRAVLAGTKVYLDDTRGAAAQWLAVEPQVSGGLVLIPQNYIAVTTGTPHGFVAEQDVDLRTTQADHTGIQRIAHVEDATTFCVEDDFRATATGSCTLAHRLQDGMRDLQMASGPYAGARIATNVTQTAFDVDLPFNGDWSGVATLPNWDVEIYADENNFRVNDQFFIGGNINYLLIRSGFNTIFKGTRLKLQKWIDPSLKADLRSARIHFDGPTRGRDDNIFDDLLVGGASTGWTQRRQGNDTGLSFPGAEFEAMEMPDASASLTGNTVTAMNAFRAYGDRLELRHSALTQTFTVTEGTLYGHGLRSATGAVNTFQLTAAATGARPEIKARSSVDTDVGVTYSTQGLGRHEFYAGTNGRALQLRGVAAGTNFPYTSSAIDGGNVIFGADGTSASVALRLSAKSAPIIFGNPPQLPTFTKATVPDAAVYARALISVSDATGGAAPCYARTTGWINMFTNTALA